MSANPVKKLRLDSEEAVAKNFHKLPALYDKESLEQGELAMQESGVNRGIAFVIGTKSGKELIDMVTEGEGDDKETLALILYAVQATKERADAFMAIAGACAARLMVALCHREDVGEIYAMADRMEAEFAKTGAGSHGGDWRELGSRQRKAGVPS